MPISLDYRKIFLWHCAAIAGLVVVHLFVVVMAALGHERLFGVAQFFDLSAESAIPEFFSALVLAATGVAAIFLAQDARRARTRESGGWSVFAAGFLFLACDEACQIHEKLDGLFEGAGFLYYNWVFIYVALAALPGLAVLGFFLRLRRATQVGLAAGFGLFLFAGGGLELIEGKFAYDWEHGRKVNLVWFAIVPTLEELGEMLAGAVLLRTVLAHAAWRGLSWTIAPARLVRPGEGGAGDAFPFDPEVPLT